MNIEAPQQYQLAESETALVSVDFQPLLDSGELLTGTPTVAEITTTDLTLANAAVNTAALTVNGVAVAISEAVQFSVTGAQPSTAYRIRVTCGTDSTPAQTRTQIVRVYGVDDGS